MTGKVVIVTGAATGLGEGYAHIFAESGCKVACADINIAEAENTAADIRSQGGSAGIPGRCDKAESIKTMVEEVLRTYGRIDVLVNNAGVEHIEPFTEVSEEHIDFITSVNLKGVFFTAQETAKAMKKNGEVKSLI